MWANVGCWISIFALIASRIFNPASFNLEAFLGVTSKPSWSAEIIQKKLPPNEISNLTCPTPSTSSSTSRLYKNDSTFLNETSFTLAPLSFN